MKKVILAMLKFYKRYISGGEHCRFYPSCSVYAYRSIEKYGVVRGGWMAIKRILKCNPLIK